jgi:hypothetical protein
MKCTSKNCETKFCQKHKCSHCNDEATDFSYLACNKHKNFEGGPYVFPDENGLFAKKF